MLHAGNQSARVCGGGTGIGIRLRDDDGGGGTGEPKSADWAGHGGEKKEEKIIVILASATGGSAAERVTWCIPSGMWKFRASRRRSRCSNRWPLRHAVNMFSRVVVNGLRSRTRATADDHRGTARLSLEYWVVVEPISIAARDHEADSMVCGHSLVRNILIKCPSRGRYRDSVYTKYYTGRL